MSNTGRVVACNSAGKKSNRMGSSGKWLAAAAGAAWVQLLPSPHGWQVARADVVVWTGATNASWDGSNSNWNDLTNPGTTYADGDNVQFSGSGPGGTVDVSTTSTTPTGVSPATVDFTSGSDNYTLTNVGSNTSGITGAATVTLDSSYAGEVVLSSANTYTGGTYVNGGILHGGSGSYSSTNTFYLGGGTLNPSSGGGSTFVAGQSIVATSGTTSTFSQGGNTVFPGSISSSAGATATGTVLNLNNADTFSAGNLNGFTGTLEMNGLGAGTVRLNYAATNSVDAGSANAIFDLGSTSSTTLESYNGGGSGSGAFPNAVPLGALEGGANTVLAGAAHSGSTVYAIGGLGLSTTFAGTIKGGTENACALYIVGGSLTLTGDNTYPGVSAQSGTTIANGALYANNAVSSVGPDGVLVEGKTGIGAGYGTLGGDGTIASTSNGTVVNSPSAGVASFAEGGLVAPGASGVGGPVGTLTITGGLTLNDYTNLAYTLNNTNTSGNDLISTLNTNLTLSGNSLTQVAFAFDNGGPELGVPYDLINYGTATLSYVAGGSNASVSGWTDTGVPAGDTATFSTPANGQVDVTFTAVPEPATIGMLGIASLGMLRRRRARA
jgi:autotransporter-associated beta strand protein